MARGADDSASGAVGSEAAGRSGKHGIVPGRGASESRCTLGRRDTDTTPAERTGPEGG